VTLLVISAAATEQYSLRLTTPFLRIVGILICCLEVVSRGIVAFAGWCGELTRKCAVAIAFGR
jgi:hypothetical protein